MNPRIHDSQGASPEPPGSRQLSRARLKYVADLLKGYATVLTGAAFLTPLFSGKTVGGFNLAWAIVGAYMALIGLIVTPGED